MQTPAAGHRLRYELEESWAADPLPGSDLGVKNVLQTEADMQNSVFCVCPPGPHTLKKSALMRGARLLFCLSRAGWGQLMVAPAKSPLGHVAGAPKTG